MGCLGNLLWLLCGGFIGAICWMIEGLLWCVTIVGIPIGIQCFKFAGLTLFPFGKEVAYGGGPVSFLANIIWIVVTGVPMAVEHLVFGAILCATVIGIPFGLQHFKLAKLALMPFGASVRF